MQADLFITAFVATSVERHITTHTIAGLPLLVLCWLTTRCCGILHGASLKEPLCLSFFPLFSSLGCCFFFLFPEGSEEFLLQLPLGSLSTRSHQVNMFRLRSWLQATVKSFVMTDFSARLSTRFHSTQVCCHDSSSLFLSLSDSLHTSPLSFSDPLIFRSPHQAPGSYIWTPLCVQARRRRC